MTNIELVIKIPEWKYKSICEGVEASKRCGVVGVDPDIHEAIANGTPLPKHGDLIDKNKLAHKMIIEDVSRFKEEPEALAGLFLRMCNKEQAVIEADKVESEGEE